MEESERKRKSRFDVAPSSSAAQFSFPPELDVAAFAKSFMLPGQSDLIRSLGSSLQSEAYVSVTDDVFKSKLERAMDKNMAFLER